MVLYRITKSHDELRGPRSVLRRPPLFYEPAVGLQRPSANMRRLAICREATLRCLKKPIDGFGDSPYIHTARIFRNECSTPVHPSYRGLRGPAVFKWEPFALVQGPQLAQGAPTGDRVLIGPPNTSKELSSLQEASYVYQENSLRRLHIGGQMVLAAAPLSLTGAFMDIAGILGHGRIQPGAQSYSDLRGPAMPC